MENKWQVLNLAIANFFDCFRSRMPAHAEAGRRGQIGSAQMLFRIMASMIGEEGAIAKQVMTPEQGAMEGASREPDGRADRQGNLVLVAGGDRGPSNEILRSHAAAAAFGGS